MADREPHPSEEARGEQGTFPSPESFKEAEEEEPQPTLWEKTDDVKMGMDLREFESKFAQDQISLQEIEKKTKSNFARFIPVCLIFIFGFAIWTFNAYSWFQDRDVKPLSPRRETHFQPIDDSRPAEVRPGDSANLTNHAHALMREGKYKEAYESAVRAVYYNHTSARALDARGLASFFCGETNQALADFSKAIALGHEDFPSTARFHRGSVLAYLGRARECALDFSAPTSGSFTALDEDSYFQEWLPLYKTAKSYSVDPEDLYAYRIRNYKASELITMVFHPGQNPGPYLALEGGTQTDLDVQQALQASPSEKLELFAKQLDERDARNLKADPFLTDLSFWRCPKISELVLPGLANSNRLRNLEFHQVLVTDQSFKYLNRYSKLDKVVIDRCPTFSATGFDYLKGTPIKSLEWFPDRSDPKKPAYPKEQLQKLKQLTGLQHLGLNSDLLPGGTHGVISSLKQLKSLTLIGQNKLSIPFFYDLLCSPSLESVTLFGPIANKDLLNLLSGNLHLKELRLCQTGMSAQDIAEVVKKLKPSVLIIDESTLKVDGGTLSAFRRLDTLRQLTLLRAAPVSSFLDYAKLKELLPNCRVDYFDHKRGHMAPRLLPP